MEPAELFWKHNGGATLVEKTLEFSLFNKSKTIRLANHPGIFRDFADLKVEDFLQFTVAYGNLDPLPADCHNTFRESLATWNSAIKSMRDAIGIWEAIKAKDVPRIKQILDITVLPVEPDLVTLARGHLETLVNFGLSSVQNVMRYDHETDKLNLIQSPRSLRGIMWLQFTKWVDGLYVRRCKTCKRWFSQIYNHDQNFCGKPCREKNFRDVRKQAEAMSAKGQSAKQIAAVLGRDVDVIRGWIAKK